MLIDASLFNSDNRCLSADKLSQKLSNQIVTNNLVTHKWDSFYIGNKSSIGLDTKSKMILKVPFISLIVYDSQFINRSLYFRYV